MSIAIIATRPGITDAARAPAPVSQARFTGADTATGSGSGSAAVVVDHARRDKLEARAHGVTIFEPRVAKSESESESESDSGTGNRNPSRNSDP